MSDNLKLQTFIDLLDNFSQGVVIYELVDRSDQMSFKFMYVNAQADIMRSPDDPKDKLSDHIGETFREAYPEIEESGFPQMLYDALINNERKTFQQYQHSSKYVSNVILAFEILPLSDDYIAGIFTDVTEQMRTEQELSRVTKLYQKLTENAPYGIVGRKGTRIVFANKTLLEMMGYESEEDLIGHDLSRFVSPRERNRLQNIAESRAKGENQPLHYESELLHRDGTILPIEIYVTIVEIPGDGQLVIGFVRDLSDLAKLRQDIEIQHRMDSIGVLASGIVHDFNNLLTAMTMNMSMVLELVNDPGLVKDLIAQSLEAANQAGDLVVQIRSLSSKSEVHHEIFDLYDPITSVFELMDKVVDPEIQFQISLDPDEYYVLANKSHIHQVILNLLSNSIDAILEKHRKVSRDAGITFTEDPYVSITVNKEPADFDSDFQYLINIVFEDNGIGIEEGIVEKIFDPLYSTKKITGSRVGQGLGLSVVYNIIKNYYQGRINVESIQYKWTRFELSIPQPDIKQPFHSEENTDDNTQLTGTETILVVDDNNYIRYSLKLWLEQLGYKVLLADNGQSALEMLEIHQGVDLIILDLIMPVYSGIRFLQNFENPNDIPLVICTGFTDAIDVSPYNVVDFIEKPFTNESIPRIIRNILD